MSSIIRATQGKAVAQPAAFNFEDLSAQAAEYLDKVRAEAARILARAQQDAVKIRQRAEQEGRQAALAAVEQMVRTQLSSVLPALRQAAQQIQAARSAWLKHWEKAAIHLSAAIAGRLIRGELTRQPEIPLRLVREALELSPGETELRIHLNPEDHRALSGQVEALVAELAPLGRTQIVADPHVGRGGCQVETRFGLIDQRIESQLQRIEEELT